MGMVARAPVSLALNGGPVDQTPDRRGERLVAVDRIGNFGAAFLLHDGLTGDWVVDAALYALDGDGWHAMSSGGMTLGGWNDESGRVPSATGWEWGVLWTLGTSGQAVEGDAGTDLKVMAVPGFAARTVAAIRVESPGVDSHYLSIQPPLSSFIAVVVAPEVTAVTLVAIDQAGEILERRTIEAA